MIHRYSVLSVVTYIISEITLNSLTNKLGEKIFADVNDRLDKAGLMMHGGTIVDASLIAAPKSTKNQDGRQNPRFLHQTD